MPAAVNRSNAAKYRKSTAITAYKEYPGRSHYTLGQDGWEEVADYALEWAAAHAVAAVTTARPAAADQFAAAR